MLKERKPLTWEQFRSLQLVAVTKPADDELNEVAKLTYEKYLEIRKALEAREDLASPYCCLHGEDHEVFERVNTSNVISANNGETIDTEEDSMEIWCQTCREGKMSPIIISSSQLEEVEGVVAMS